MTESTKDAIEVITNDSLHPNYPSRYHKACQVIAKLSSDERAQVSKIIAKKLNQKP